MINSAPVLTTIDGLYGPTFFTGNEKGHETGDPQRDAGAALALSRTQTSPMLPSINPSLDGFDALASANRNPQREKEKGDAGDDVYTAEGNTIYRALGGDDTITIRKANNIVVGGRGNDYLDAQQGRGNNVLKGGGGEDVLIGGGRDDLLVGGGGADQLVIVNGKRFKKGISRIKNFKKGDTIALFNNNKANEFSDLSFKKQKKNTLIQVGKRDIAEVIKMTPKMLKQRADDFIFSDTPDIVPIISIGDRSTVEADVNTTVEFTVNLDQPASATVTVDYAIAPNSAFANQDYIAPNGSTLTFAPGNQTASFTVTIVGDTIPESEKTFFVNLSGASGGIIGTPQATGTIVDNDVRNETDPTISINDLTIPEGNTNSTAIFTVTLNTPASQLITVDYNIADGSAIANQDYTPITGTLSFPTGAQSQTIAVPVLGDTADELDETFVVNLTNAQGGIITDAQGQGTIADDDVVNISIRDTSVIEGDNGNSVATFSVTLSALPSAPVTVNYATTNGTAIADEDYTAVNDTLTFTTNTLTQTITVPILGDSEFEEDQTFVVNLSSPVGAAIATAQATATIFNDDLNPDFRPSRTGKKIAKPSATPELNFNIFDTESDGRIIMDSDSSADFGVFNNAIEDFVFDVTSLRENTSTREDVTATVTFTQGNLNVDRSGDLLQYTFSSPDFEALVRDDNGGIVQNNSDLGGEVLVLTIDLASGPITIPSDFDADRAVNDLDYIIEEAVFQYASFGTGYGGVSASDIEFFPGDNDDEICEDGTCNDLTEDIS